MALSNFFREPLRELIESIVGISVVLVVGGGGGWVDYLFAGWFQAVTGGSNGGCPMPFGMIFGVSGLVVIGILVFFAHFLGESVCDMLDRRDVQLRPTQRR